MAARLGKYFSTGHLYTGSGSPLNEFTSLFVVLISIVEQGRNRHYYYLLTDLWGSCGWYLVFVCADFTVKYLYLKS